MTITIKLSTGKEIVLTLEELNELFENKGCGKITYIPYTPTYEKAKKESYPNSACELH